MENNKIIEELKEEIEGLHKYKPKIVFLTETSAIPFGYMLKEAWKKAYPNEKSPIFYRINPKSLLFTMDLGKKVSKNEKDLKDWISKYHNPEKRKKMKEEFPEMLREIRSFKRDKRTFDNKHKKSVEKFFKYRIKNKKNPIFVYDEDSTTGKSPGAIVRLLKNPEKYGFSEDIKCDNVRMVSPTLESGKYECKKHLVPEVHGIMEPFSSITIKAHSNLRGWIIRKRAGKSTRDLIKKYKSMGKEAGEELYEELGRKKNLESKLSSIIAVSSIAISLIFLSTNLTGFTISNLTQQTSSIIGIILFIIGLISALYYFKRRKQTK